MPRTLGYKIKNSKTGLFSAPGIIGFRWTNVGRTYSNKSALSNSISVWKERIARYKRPGMNSADWVVVELSEHGITEYDFDQWVAARPKTPLPLNADAVFTLTTLEIDEVLEAMRSYIGDADAAGELSQRVEAILKRYESNRL